VKAGLAKINEPLLHFNDTFGYIIIVVPEKIIPLTELIHTHVNVEKISKSWKRF